MTGSNPASACVSSTDPIVSARRAAALERLGTILDQHFPGQDLEMLAKHSPDYYDYLFDGFAHHCKARIVRYVPGKQA